MSNYSAKETKAELKDASWFNNTNQTKEFTEIVLNSKPNNPELNLIFWILDQLSSNNEEVLVAVDDNWNFLVKDKTITIYNSTYGLEADKLDKHKKVLITFWDLLEHTKATGMKLRFMNNETAILYSAIFSIYKNDYKNYRKLGHTK